jgi:phage terminase small subunit
MEQFEADPLDKDLRGATKDAWDRFWSIAKDFGATPVARARLQLHGDDGKPDSPMDKLRELMASRN